MTLTAMKALTLTLAVSPMIVKRGGKKMKCGDNCGYWWKDEDEDYPSCHFDQDSPFPAPCEYDGEEDDTDLGYDD